MLRRPLLWAPGDDAGVGGIDEDCLALIRPVYSGGSWAPGDASPYEWTVTTSRITIGAEGTGPWGGSSRALVDSRLAYYSSITGGTAFGAARTGSMLFKPTAAATTTHLIWHIRTASAARPYVGFGYSAAPSPRQSSHVRLFVYCAATASNPYVYVTAPNEYPLNSWIFCGIILPETTPGEIELWADGSLIATTDAITPATGQSNSSFVIGEYFQNYGNGAIGHYAEAGVWSVERDLSVVPSGPYTED